MKYIMLNIKIKIVSLIEDSCEKTWHESTKDRLFFLIKFV